MSNDYKIDDELADKKSEGSCRLSKSRRIKKTQKDKQKTPKITNFFKKMETQLNQRPVISSQKRQQKRCPEQEQRIQLLNMQERQLQHQQELLKKQILTMRSEQQLMHDQSNHYLKRLRQCEIADLKQRYQLVRQCKQMPNFGKQMCTHFDMEKSTIFQFSSLDLKSKDMSTFHVKELLQQIDQKKYLLNQQGQKIPSFRKSHLQDEVNQLETELRVIFNANEAYAEKFILAQKQKKCKFALMNWPLLNKKYQTLQLIGAGGYSEVYKALNLVTNEIIAIKLCSVAQMAHVSSEIYLKHLFRQCETHKKLDHQNIVKLYEVIELDKTTFSLVLEYCQGPELSKYIKKKRQLTPLQAKGIMFQIFQTIYYLNTFSPKKIVHYDLKPQNIMFHRGVIKILDFGLNKQIDEQQSRAALTSVGMGTHAYLPPEIHQQDDDKVLTSKVDIWSAGIIFYELLNGKRPQKVEDVLRQQDLQKYSQKDSYNIRGEQKTTTGMDIIKKCLTLNPHQRISPREIYFDSYFDEFQRKYSKQ